MTHDELVTAFKQLVGDVDASKWDTAPNTATDYINRAVQEFAEILMFECRGNWFVETADTNIVSGTAEYSLPTDCLAVREHEWRGGSYNYPMSEVDFREREEYEDANITTLSPRNSYYTRDNKVGIVPTPASNVTAGLRTYYYKEHAAISGSTAPSWPASHHYGIVYRAAMHALRMDEEADHWIVDEWFKAVKRAKRVFNQRVRGGRRYVKDLRSRVR
jgi:hypothetical protein